MKVQELTTKFLKSNYINFEEFYNEEIMSTGFATEVKPETALEIDKEEGEDNEKV